GALAQNPSGRPSTSLRTNGYVGSRHSVREPRQRTFRGNFLAFAGGAALQLDHAFLQPLGADDQLPGESDHIHGRELGAAALIAIVVERLDAGLLKLAVESVRSLRAGRIIGAHVDEADLVGRNALRPDDAVVVVACLDDCAHQPRNADAVAAHLRMDLAAV